MKYFNLILLVVLLLFCCAFVSAQDRVETTDEVIQQIHDYESLEALDYDADIAESKDAEYVRNYLTGNILLGVWAKSNTRQYFAPSGSTWYQESESPQSHGTWRVRDDGKYCSVWPPSRSESCYEVSFMDDVLFWHSGKNRYPSAIQVIEDESEPDTPDDDDSEENTEKDNS